MATKKKAKPKKHSKSAEDHLRALLEALAELHRKHETGDVKGAGDLRWAAVDAADNLAHVLAESAQVPRLITIKQLNAGPYRVAMCGFYLPYE